MTVIRGTEDIMVTTNQGTMIRFAADSVSQTGRATMGVRLMRLEADATVVTLAKVAHVISEQPSTETTEQETV